MKNLLPCFIVEKFKRHEFHGFFDAATLFLDISGFTTLTENLASHGKEGAEVLEWAKAAWFSSI